MGAALCLKAAYPQIDVRIFSVFLYKGYAPEFENFVDPTFGTLSYDADTDCTHRDPL